MRSLFALLLAIVGCWPVSAAQQLREEDRAAVVRLLSAFMKSNRVPGLSAAIVSGGRLVWADAYGTADLEHSVPAKTTTAYRSASIGKTMTATAAMQLVEDRKLDLGVDIRRYCPAFPAKPWTITPLQLLNHTSGIRHYGGNRDREEQTSTVHYESVAAALAPFKDDLLLFEPGTSYHYTTYGYDVLGCVIEGAAGMPFLSYMRDHVWGPASMISTRDDDPGALVANRAGTYTLRDGALVNAPMVDMSNRLPAGGYLTTVNDLAHFAEALFDRRLIQQRTFDDMIAPTRLPDGQTVSYGLGWGVEIEDWLNDRWVYHGGSSPGASGILALMPRRRFAVAILTNLDELPGRPELAENIARIVIGGK
jgi:serine beta-lactamase-like protein LACTB